MSRKQPHCALVLLIAASVGGCAGDQSAFSPAGPHAESIDTLFWIMTVAGLLIFLAVMAMAAVAIGRRGRLGQLLSSERFVIGAGIVFPIAILTLLLTYGLFVMRAGAPLAAGEDALRIKVSGERWWWRITYVRPDGTTFESANEIRIPVGRPVVLELTTADVIHSFWVPKLAGKLDMIPGRTNELTLQASAEGVSRGQCAEYCGGAHALMSLYVVALAEDAFQEWFAREAGPAPPPETDRERLGQQIFLQNGCGGCHTIRGIGANGAIGPDLTHVGSRLSLAAAALPNDTQAFARWIRNNQHIKPDNLMPDYTILDESQLIALASYLEGLK
ncbi:cytochrome c oxidase subunit II [Rhodoligotrophos defluvii]|uniref:cytochrome c oxidase subunit II n=1 Tax=Rhodoligotrophos defluvii TaxID=2561934 RepID=UPI0010C9A169|nr:cytochrome c oxidase subunit II [Rhodoligotrophos defluvii]